MSTKTAPESQKPDPKTVEFEAAKAAFEAAKKKTAVAEGREPAPEKAPEPVEAVAEKPAAEPKKKLKAPKAPEPKSEPSGLEKQIAALNARLDAALAPKEQEPEPDEALDGIRAKLTERFGEEEAADVLESIEARHAPLAKRIAQLEKILEQATQAGRQSISKSNQKRLAEIYPQLKREEAWKVLHAQALAAFERDPKAYESAEDAYDALAIALYGEPESEESESEDEEEAPDDVEVAASRIAASAMTTPGRTRSERRTPEEKHRELHAYIVKHPDDKAGHRRLARELGLRP